LLLQKRQNLENSNRSHRQRQKQAAEYQDRYFVKITTLDSRFWYCCHSHIIAHSHFYSRLPIFQNSSAPPKMNTIPRSSVINPLRLNL